MFVRRLAPIAQVVERVLGKDEVGGSNPPRGSVDPGTGRHRSGCTPGPIGHGGIAQAVEQAAHNRCVTGSSPVPATKQHRAQLGERTRMAKKSGDIRPKITLACTECKDRNYITKKNRRNTPDRLEVMKFCKRENKHTLHRETR